MISVPLPLSGAPSNTRFPFSSPHPPNLASSLRSRCRTSLGAAGNTRSSARTCGILIVVGVSVSNLSESVSGGGVVTFPPQGNNENGSGTLCALLWCLNRDLRWLVQASCISPESNFLSPSYVRKHLDRPDLFCKIVWRQEEKSKRCVGCQDMRP